MLKQRRNRKTFTEKTGYSARILEPGYLGTLSPKELKIIKQELRNRLKLRNRWGFIEGEEITNTKIQTKAMGGRIDNDGFIYSSEAEAEYEE